jgi:hypothetical protein
MASQKRVLWLNRVSRLAQAKRCGGALEMADKKSIAVAVIVKLPGSQLVPEENSIDHAFTNSERLFEHDRSANES